MPTENDARTILQSTDEIEIVDVRDLRTKRVSEIISAVDHAPIVRLSGEQTEDVLKLWHSLPPGEAMRCYFPAYGLRFYHGQRRLAQVFLCWQCNYLAGEIENAPYGKSFDGEHETSRQLLSLCQTAFDHDSRK